MSEHPEQTDPAIRRGFHAELDAIRADAVRLAAMVTERIPWGTDVLLGDDLDAAQALIDADDELDSLTVSIEERCYQQLVLQAPMAGDLRAIITALRVVSELERAGDLMVNVAKARRRLYGVELDPRLRGLIARMGAEAQRLVEISIDAFAEGDDGKAAALDDLDDHLDDMHREFIQAIFETHRDSALDLEVGVQLALVGRYYERIGDHAVNIGERVRYMVSGWMPDYPDATPPDPRARNVATFDHRPMDDQEARRTVDQLFRVLDALPLGLALADASGTVVFRNRMAAEFVAARHGAALVESALDELIGVALGGAGATRELTLHGPPRRSFTLRSVTLNDRTGARAGAFVVIDDTSERRRLDAVRRDFIANISHELKTPIGAVGVLAEALTGEDDPAVTRRLAERIHADAFRMSRTIDDLLELTRIEVAEPESREPVVLRSVVDDAIGRAESAAGVRGVQVAVVEEDAGVVVSGDHRQLVSAVANLLDNAVKYSEQGSAVTVVVRVADGWAEVAVADHGIGIPARDRERIFERFYRVDVARSRDTGGTGLGLSIVRHIVENHGGEVRVSSEEGDGSTFTLRLPCDATTGHAVADDGES